MGVYLHKANQTLEGAETTEGLVVTALFLILLGKLNRVFFMTVKEQCLLSTARGDAPQARRSTHTTWAQYVHMTSGNNATRRPTQADVSTSRRP